MLTLFAATRIGKKRITMKVHFITYANNDFVTRAQLLVRSALDAGFTHGTAFGPHDIAQSDFARRNYDILSQPRGAGYWLWKPFIIRQALANCRAGEVVFYSDAGRTDYYKFTRLPRYLLAEVQQNGQGFLLGPAVGHLGRIGDWTKRDCLILMNADYEEMQLKPLIMTWSLWTPSDRAFQFLDAWQSYAEDARCLTDTPNSLGYEDHSGFREHRHDQSIFSILAHQMEAPYLDFSRTFVQRAINMRPQSSVGNLFYKRPQNADDLLRGDNPLLLLREHMRLKFQTCA